MHARGGGIQKGVAMESDWCGRGRTTQLRTVAADRCMCVAELRCTALRRHTCVGTRSRWTSRVMAQRRSPTQRHGEWTADGSTTTTQPPATAETALSRHLAAKERHRRRCSLPREAGCVRGEEVHGVAAMDICAAMLCIATLIEDRPVSADCDSWS